ncbi:MAG: hypothetical protein LBQ96_03855 [Fusobacteriaceae bacterium]|nr:hypothetical protein [Fusobacteriaceae bacterium]
MKKIRVILSLLLFTLTLFAKGQSSYSHWFTNLRRRPVPPRIIFIERVPRVTVQENREQITLRDLKIQVEIIGNVALTTYDMTFQNPNAVVMEGEFEMPLGDNQNVSAIALDINGKMREGVVVEKEKARQTFEAIVRKGVDPALVEKTSGNQYRMRIYPFTAKGTRRLRVTIEEPLAVEDGRYIYDLPLKFKQSLNFSLDVLTANGESAGAPQISGDLPLAAQNTRNGTRFHFDKEDFLLNHMLTLTFPREKEDLLFTHKEGRDTYFYGDIPLEAQWREKKLPQKIAIYWDTSLSGEKRAISRELELLDAYFRLLSDVEVELIPFGLTKDSGKAFTVKEGAWAELRQTIESIKYDGGTVFPTDLFAGLTAEEILLFSDGLNTMGEKKPSVSAQAVYTINSSPEYNRGFLEDLARSSGGNFINLNTIDAESALKKLAVHGLKLLKIESKEGIFRNIHPTPGVEVGENLTFAGILSGNAGRLLLSFGYGKDEIVLTKEVPVGNPGNNPAVSRLWARQRIRELEWDPEENEKEITKLGKEYSVVTDFTSLLVLENISDYVNYKIAPPPELQDEYNRYVSSRPKQQNQAAERTEEQNINASITIAKSVKDWYLTEFDQSKPPQSFQKLKTQGSTGARAPVSPSRKNANKNGATKTGSVAANYVSNLFNNKPLQSAPPATKGPPKKSAIARKSVASAPVAKSASRSAPDTASMSNRDTYYAPSGVSAGASAQNRPAAESKEVGIAVRAWDPETPYMKILEKTSDQELYMAYLMIKAGYDDQPSFFFDVTDEFIRRNQKEKALVILSGIADMKLDSPELLRTAANKFMEVGAYDYALVLFRKILKLRGEDPQSYRDLALACEAAGQKEAALEYFYKILTGYWDRFESIKEIVFVEMNALISRNPGLNTKRIRPDLIFPMPVDLRVVLGWSTDNTDIDLHVKDPYGEITYYGHKKSRIGGRLTTDLTAGFGPEEFMLKKAINGDYVISTNNFANRRQGISGPTVLYLDIYTYYGSSKETHKRMLLRTDKVKETSAIGTVNFAENSQ